jgi:hypothetical protein
MQALSQLSYSPEPQTTIANATGRPRRDPQRKDGLAVYLQTARVATPNALASARFRRRPAPPGPDRHSGAFTPSRFIIFCSPNRDSPSSCAARV